MTRLYFAYGSNMCKTQMAARSPGAQRLGSVEIAGYRFLINKQGYATLISDPSARIFGTIWSITEQDEAQLDIYESVASSLYLKDIIDIPNYGPALVYFALDQAPGIPGIDYIEAIIEAARDQGFPLPYIKELASWRVKAGEPVANFHTNCDSLPSTAGAYVLWIDLPNALSIRLSARSPTPLAAGRYLYCGSANGPGGIKARVGRHMRLDKSLRWHVDQLTTAGKVVGAWAFPDAQECALVASLSHLPKPIPGFGSSDCHHCISHLLEWPATACLPYFMSWAIKDSLSADRR